MHFVAALVLTKEEVQFMNKSPVWVEEKPSWPQSVLVTLAFFVSALGIVGLLALVFDTLP